MTLDFLRFSHYYYTNRSEESLDKYLVEINRIPMITPDQEVELAQILPLQPNFIDSPKQKRQSLLYIRIRARRILRI